MKFQITKYKLVKLDQYLQILNQTEEQFNNQLKETALKELTNYLLTDAVAKKEGIAEISNEEIEFEFAKLAEQYGMTIDDVRKAIEPQMDEFRNNVKMNRVDKLLFEENN